MREKYVLLGRVRKSDCALLSPYVRFPGISSLPLPPPILCPKKLIAMDSITQTLLLVL